MNRKQNLEHAMSDQARASRDVYNRERSKKDLNKAKTWKPSKRTKGRNEDERH